MRAAAFLVIAALAGCHRAPPQHQALDALDDRLAGNGAVEADPALAALHDRIVVDLNPSPFPTRTPAATPAASTDDATVKPPNQAPQRSATKCAPSLRHAPTWAGRLPSGLALYPGALIGEAAGSDENVCALRVVSFTSADPVARLADWYRNHARAAGYAVEDRTANGGHTLGGDRGGGAFMLYLVPRRGGGTDADLIVDATP